MILIKKDEQLLRILITKFGRSHGIGDNAARDSAVTRPFQTVDGEELYLPILEKAAALIESRSRQK